MTKKEYGMTYKEINDILDLLGDCKVQIKFMAGRGFDFQSEEVMMENVLDKIDGMNERLHEKLRNQLIEGLK